MKLTLLLFFSVCTVAAQNISGNVLELGSNTPIEYVNVYWEKGRVGTITNINGEYHLELGKNMTPTDTIRFSIIGYTTKHYTLSQLKKLDFTVHLSRKAENLEAVTVNSQAALKTSLPFSRLAPLKQAVYGFGSLLHNNHIYVVGGNASYLEDSEERVLNEISSIPGATIVDFIEKSESNFTWEHYSDQLQTYDITNDSWSTADIKFTKRAYHKLLHLDDKLYVLGGKTLSVNKKYEYLDNTIEVFNLTTKQRIVDDTNPHQAINFAAMTYKDNIIVMGGSTKMNKHGEKVYSNKAHMYNTTSGYWYELPNMTKPKEANGILIKDKVFLIGGFNEEPLSKIECYNLTDGTWTTKGNLFLGMENPALAHHDNTIYIFSNGKMLTYNIDNKVINEYTIELYVKYAEMYYHQGYLYILGGFKEDNYSITPSSRVSAVSLNDFKRTRSNKSKTLD